MTEERATLRLYVESDADCDCGWRNRWRIVAYDWRSDRDVPVAHTLTKLGARWKVWRMGGEIEAWDGGSILI